MFNATNLFHSAQHCRSHLTHYVSLRWKRIPRKPFWLGIAKTKMFKIPPYKGYAKDDKAEYERLECIYNRQMDSLKEFMCTNRSNLQKDKYDNDGEISVNLEKARIFHENWNNESARLRNERIVRMTQEMEEKALEKAMKMNEKNRLMTAAAEEIVKTEINLSKTYITEENLDSAIEECLANVRNYNFAIDLKGNIYKEGSEPVDKLKPVSQMEKIEESFSREAELNSSAMQPTS